MWKMVKKDGKYPSIHPSGIHPINSFATFAFGEREMVRLMVNGKKMPPCCTFQIKRGDEENGKKCRHVAHSGLKAVIWKMVKNDEKYPSIHSSIWKSSNQFFSTFA
jgi:hypothetical protein